MAWAHGVTTPAVWITAEVATEGLFSSDASGVSPVSSGSSTSAGNDLLRLVTMPAEALPKRAASIHSSRSRRLVGSSARAKLANEMV